jgi:hypothetical protein
MISMATLMVAGCATQSNNAKDRRTSAAAAVASLQKINLAGAGAQTRASLLAAPGAPPVAGAPVASPTNDLDDAYQNMMGYCSNTLTKFQQQSNRLTYWTVAVAVVGSVAGSIAVPALTAAASTNKVWISAMGGISGTANAGQQALSSGGLTSASVLQSRETVLTNWKKDIADYYDSTKTLAEQKVAIEKSFADCELYDISTTSTSKTN